MKTSPRATMLANTWASGLTEAPPRSELKRIAKDLAVSEDDLRFALEKRGFGAPATKHQAVIAGTLNPAAVVHPQSGDLYAKDDPLAIARGQVPKLVKDWYGYGDATHIAHKVINEAPPRDRATAYDLAAAVYEAALGFATDTRGALTVGADAMKHGSAGRLEGYADYTPRGGMNLITQMGVRAFEVALDYAEFQDQAKAVADAAAGWASKTGGTELEAVRQKAEARFPELRHRSVAKHVWTEFADLMNGY